MYPGGNNGGTYSRSRPPIKSNVLDSPNNGIRFLVVEVPLANSGSGLIFNFPDQPVLNGREILGIEAWCNTGGAITPPSGFYPIPLGILSQKATWTYTDMCNSFLQLNDDSNLAVMDREPVPVFNPPSNFGQTRFFPVPLIGVVWTQCKLFFGQTYTVSAANLVALFIVKYRLGANELGK